MRYPQRLRILFFAETGRPELETLIRQAAAAIDRAAASVTAKDALPLLTEAQEQLTRAIDEAMGCG